MQLRDSNYEAGVMRIKTTISDGGRLNLERILVVWLLLEWDGQWDMGVRECGNVCSGSPSR